MVGAYKLISRGRLGHYGCRLSRRTSESSAKLTIKSFFKLNEVKLRFQVKRMLDVGFIKLLLDHVLSGHWNFKLELEFRLSSYLSSWLWKCQILKRLILAQVKNHFKFCIKDWYQFEVRCYVFLRVSSCLIESDHIIFKGKCWYWCPLTLTLLNIDKVTNIVGGKHVSVYENRDVPPETNIYPKV